MKRSLVALGLVAVLATPAVVIAQSPPTPDEAMEQIAAIVIEAGYARPNQTTTTTAPPTTTTTATTTTRPRPSTTTSTTAPATTTTTAPPTTTTTAPVGSPSGDKYDFFVNVYQVGRAWTAPYFYDLSPPFASGSGWADGNRDGYKCAYGILLWNNDPVGRVTFTRVEGAAAYTIINDQGMPDRGDTLRHYNTGSLFPQPVQQGECPPPTETYEPNTQPGQLPVIDFLGPNGELLERRDYRNIVIEDPRLKFRLHFADELRVTVIAYWENNPFVVIYYDAPSDWSEGVTVHGYLP